MRHHDIQGEVRLDRLKTAMFGIALATVASAVPAVLCAEETDAGQSVAAGRAFSARDLAMLERVSNPRISPNGHYVAYVVRKTDWANNRASYSLEILDLRRSSLAARVLLSGERGGISPRWSADGRWLYHLSSKSGSQQLWKTAPETGGHVQVTAFPIGVEEFTLDEKERKLVLSADAYPACDTLTCIRGRDSERELQIGNGVLTTSGPSRYGDRYEDEKVVGLFEAEISLGDIASDARRLVREFKTDLSAGKDSLSFSRDGGQIYFAGLDPAAEKGDETFRGLFSIAPGGAEAYRRVAGSLGNWIGAFAVSPDGKRLAYLATEGSMWTFGRTTVMVLDLESGKSRELTRNTDKLFREILWSPDGRSLLAVASETAQAKLYRIDVISGRLTALTQDGTLSEIDAAGEAIVYLHESFRAPADIMVQGADKPARRLTQVRSAGLDGIGLSDAEQFSFRGWNGETVFGHIVKPHDFVEGRRYPVAFLIHGGPQGSFSNSWSYRWNPQVWAGLGYAVVMIDFHGSTGYGSEFGRASVGHWGDRPLEDLQKGWSHVLENYPYLDAERACALGGSYGGYMINWLASQWNTPWKCLVNHAGVVDVRFQKHSTGISAFMDAQFGGRPTNADLDRSNPILYADRWRTPMLFTHGVNDFLVPIDQGVSAYNVARSRKVPAEILVFPDENHHILRPRNSVQWYTTIETWLARWTPPGR